MTRRVASLATGNQMTNVDPVRFPGLMRSPFKHRMTRDVETAGRPIIRGHGDAVEVESRRQRSATHERDADQVRLDGKRHMLHARSLTRNLRRGFEAPLLHLCGRWKLAISSDRVNAWTRLTR